MDAVTINRLFRKAPMWVIASHNSGKIKEIADLVRPFSIAVKGAGELSIPEPEETEKTFSGNALLKARASAKASGTVALADDSGLEVNALGGDPGIYSARWAGPDRDFQLAMRTVEEKLQASGSPDRSARFVCALALAHPDGAELVFEGEVSGHLVWPPRGENGFGYDPVFVPHGHEVTFGEMDPAAKHAMSHRANAFRKLVTTVLTP
ncbi:MAG: RdgB/HAM1 family non-canonical purine NTP pyrophosphatase [Oceanicaulis sp.]|uniref:RdgB/HAM1 family non-canonical purine NTP pyrophosphatase n=1 Tax=Glycocaulis sp. TaxID=1969725 RepID=UPI0025C539EA|nr:RdgB/HAM1 family non-canonical purine NTP pyrophosphatase [Glycocaulis sp.]MCC5982534.1 RdgB/HAM1 family non-canonical purine NTP pyrophosphatase [Oceanicaulis sp.]MCH8522019.1 RdgB/HAM1 family non-canonical purine NTP pyrophosphatase [Glycocaulis sp.]